MGADDYLASEAGRTYRELLATFRQYDPADFAAERLKRGELLRLALEDLKHTFWALWYRSRYLATPGVPGTGLSPMRSSSEQALGHPCRLQRSS
jgi:hypothetical protein